MFMSLEIRATHVRVCHHIVHAFIFVFFFQAEDGIRDVAVTGVQTCALPISSGDAHFPSSTKRTEYPACARFAAGEPPGHMTISPPSATIIPPRSEEHTSELQSRLHLVCRLLLEKKKKKQKTRISRS